MSDRKLKAWQAAGLIDEETVKRIQTWEHQQTSPWAMWALIGLGALTIGLGLISLIAANWDALAGSTRLIIHFLVLVACAIWLALRGLNTSEDETLTRFADAGLFILVFLGVTFIGHVGQVYQSSAPLWQALALAAVIFTPLLVLFGRTKMTGLLWLVGVLAAVGTHTFWFIEQAAKPPTAYLGLLGSAPAVMVAMAAIAPLYAIGHPGFWRAVEKTGLLVVAWGATLLSVAGSFAYAPEKFSNLAVLVLISVAAAAAVALLRKDKNGHGVAMVLVMSAGVTLLAGMMSEYVNIFNTMLVIGLWGGIAWVSLGAGWRRLFQTAIGVAAVRLIILSFELGGDLLGSGVGLIITGLITLGIAWMAFRISRTYAPRKQGDAA